jgi:hypothetical protein
MGRIITMDWAALVKKVRMYWIVVKTFRIKYTMSI